MKDFFGQELKVDDLIAFEQPKYRSLIHGVVVAFTPQRVRVAWNSPNYGFRIEHVDGRGREWTDLFVTHPSDVIKNPKQD